jgi:hypothetical protein
MSSTTHVPSDAPAPDRLTQLEASFRDLKAILDDPLQLIDRLRELELQRRAK